ncbi:MAG: ATP-binding protein [Prevotella sp.]|nr:ATP-binding protein [Prevotella sp.]
MMTIPVWAVVAAVAVAVALYVRLLLHYRRNTRKVALMFDAIDNNDLSFAFHTSGVPTDDALLNRSLNRIKLVLAHARDEAVEREKYYEQIMDAAGTGLLVTDAAGHILQHNHAATVLLQRQVLTHLDQVRSRLDDGTLSLRETYTTLRGERVRIIAVSDINSELANREVDSWIKLIRVLTHEIMNTITPITSLSQTLLCKASGEQREGLETISRTGSELMAFVDNYRRFTHVPQPQPKLFYVKPFAERMARLAPCEVEVNVCPADLLVYADEGLMARVMSNLLKNAAEAVCAADEEHGSQGRKVWIDAYTGSDDSVVMDVCDNAGIIDADTAQHVFVPFFTTKPGGNGIGLPLARQIMRVSGGTLSLVQDAKRDMVVFRMKI